MNIPPPTRPWVYDLFEPMMQRLRRNKITYWEYRKFVGIQYRAGLIRMHEAVEMVDWAHTQGYERPLCEKLEAI